VGPEAEAEAEAEAGAKATSRKVILNVIHETGITAAEAITFTLDPVVGRMEQADQRNRLQHSGI
jgi:hypothetical protein